jgi:hypothetical protein
MEAARKNDHQNSNQTHLLANCAHDLKTVSSVMYLFLIMRVKIVGGEGGVGRLLRILYLGILYSCILKYKF